MVRFALSGAAEWIANFRDLNAAVARMATLSEGGRISVACVKEETSRLSVAWGGGAAKPVNDLLSSVLSPGQIDDLDPFDKVQLEHVLTICRRSRSLSEAGRALFNASRAKKTSTNDADRLRKYLARFNLDWNSITR